MRLWLIIGKLIAIVLQIRGSRATALPGLIIEKLNASFLQQARRHAGIVILITGTNGKTSTQTVLSALLRKTMNAKVLVNTRGANLKRGLISEIIKQFQIFGRNDFDYFVFEVEEATLPRVVDDLSPNYLIVTNFFRDQLDAYGEIERTKMHVANAIKKADSKCRLLLNQDDPQVLDMIAKSHSEKEAIAVSVLSNSKYIKYEQVDEAVEEKVDKAEENQGFSEILKLIPIDSLPNLAYSFQMEEVDQVLHPQLPGFYSLYAYGFSLAILKSVTGTGFTKKINSIANAIASTPPAFGRGEVIKSDKLTRELQFFLIKNPIGFDMSIDLLKNYTQPIDLVILINDKIADGRDVSWLWDAQLEELKHVKLNNLYVAGSRAHDMRLRLKYAEIRHAKLFQDYQSLIAELKTDSTSQLKCLATYTAMNEFRDLLTTKR